MSAATVSNEWSSIQGYTLFLLLRCSISPWPLKGSLAMRTENRIWPCKATRLGVMHPSKCPPNYMLDVTLPAQGREELCATKPVWAPLPAERRGSGALCADLSTNVSTEHSLQSCRLVPISSPATPLPGSIGHKEAPPWSSWRLGLSWQGLGCSGCRGPRGLGARTCGRQEYCGQAEICRCCPGMCSTSTEQGPSLPRSRGWGGSTGRSAAGPVSRAGHARAEHRPAPCLPQTVPIIYLSRAGREP